MSLNAENAENAERAMATVEKCADRLLKVRFPEGVMKAKMNDEIGRALQALGRIEGMLDGSGLTRRSGYGKGKA